jgi:hypothetical protein
MTYDDISIIHVSYTLVIGVIILSIMWSENSFFVASHLVAGLDGYWGISGYSSELLPPNH